MAAPIETYRGSVFPWECDINGHMNVRFFVAKFDEGTWQLGRAVGMGRDYMERERRGAMAVEQTISYRRELMPGDTVYVRSSIVSVAPRKYRLRHEMLDAVSDEPVAEMEILAVHVDLETRRAVPMSDEAQARLRAHLVEKGEDA